MPEAITTGITYLINQTTSILTLVTGNAVLSLGVAAWCIGLGISFFKRLV
nr:MAG TPA: hypothetical protein [Inoviridae sp.]